MLGEISPKAYPQHIPFEMSIDLKRDSVALRRSRKGPNGKAVYTPDSLDSSLDPIPSGLKLNQKFDITIEIGEDMFTVTFDLQYFWLFTLKKF